MKLPAKVEKYLFSNGFIPSGGTTSSKGAYSRKKACLNQLLEPDRNACGYCFYTSVWYPGPEGRLVLISPDALGGIKANGEVCGDRSYYEMKDDSYFLSKETDRMIAFLGTHIEKHFERLMDAELMVRVYQYLRGHNPHDKEIVEIFPILPDRMTEVDTFDLYETSPLREKAIEAFREKNSLIEAFRELRGLPDPNNRKEENKPLYIKGIAAYLNLLGRFDEAKEYLSLLKRKDEFRNKLLSDAENREVRDFDILSDIAAVKKKTVFDEMEMSKNVCIVYIAKEGTNPDSDDFLTKTLALKKGEVGDWLVYFGDVNKVVKFEGTLTEKLSPLSKNTKLFMWLTQNVTGALWFELHENEKLKRKWYAIEGEVQNNIGEPLPEEKKGMFTSEEDEDGERDGWEVVEIAEKITGIKW